MENILGPSIKRIRKEKHLTQKDLGKITGFSQNTVSQHESGSRVIDEKAILKYSQALGVTPQELFNSYLVKESLEKDRFIKDPFQTNIDNTVDILKKLEEPRQQNVYNYATHQLSEQNNNVVQLSDYTDNVEHTETVYGAVSAGTGQYLDHEQPEQVVVRGSAPEHDFAVKVVGNSMEPTFNDGQIVYVNKLVDESDIRNNQFVIAEVNGEAFIKKLSFSEDYVKLISLNPNYDDIIIHDYDDFLIRGIVVI